MITKNRHIYITGVVSTMLTSSIVAAVVFLLYPPEDIARELIIDLSLAVGLTFPITSFMASLVLRNHELSEELRRVVERDRLTDVATRDYFFAKLEQEPEAYGISLMIDIDHFKRINDTFGHLAGDCVIREVAGLIRQEVRTHDIVCRFGGEEFVVFLHRADASEGARIAERMRMAVEVAEIRVGDVKVRATVSIGGSMKQAADDVSVSIQLAHTALYKAKQSGRNRIVMDAAKDGQADPATAA